MKKGSVSKLLSLKKELTIEQKPVRFFSFSVSNKYVSANKINIYKSITNKSLLKKNVKKNRTIKINYKGKIILVPKIDYYKMKIIDIGKLKAHKKVNKELIKQKKFFIEKEDLIFNKNKIDLISKLKEKEYRNEITNLQKEILNKDNHKKEIYIYYKIILLIIKDIAEKLISDIENNKKETENRIKYNVKLLDEKFQDKFNKDCESSDFLFHKLKELIGRMNIIINNFENVNQRIKYYNKDNLILKKKLNDLNYINRNLCLHIKKKEMENNKAENDSNYVEEKQNISFYRKINKNIINRNISRGKEYNTILSKKILRNIEFNTGQTYFTSNNMNSLTNRSTNKNNMLSLSNNFLSITSTSMQNNDSSRQNINIKEINYINNLKNKIENLKKKIKIKLKKIEENRPKNAFYDLIIKIMNQLKKDESVNVINKINNKLLNDNMKILPYQNIKVRNKFIDKLLGDVELYKILNSKNLKGINYFDTKLFGQDIGKQTFV